MNPKDEKGKEYLKHKAKFGVKPKNKEYKKTHV